jgi:alkylmercury lyase
MARADRGDKLICRVKTLKEIPTKKEVTVGNARAIEATRKLTRPGGPVDYGPVLSRLLVRVMRELAQGRPVPRERVDEIVAEMGIARDEAYRLLEGVAERDTDENIFGIMGLSLNDTPHRFYVNGAQMSAWCAEDTLFLPAVLGRSATVESVSPVSGKRVRLTVSPQGVEEVDPTGAVVSVVIVDPDNPDMGSVEAIWGAYCHHTFFFASRQEAERWAAGRDDIEILSVGEAYELGQQLSSRFLAYGV